MRGVIHLVTKKDKRLLYYIIANIILISMMIAHTLVYIDALRNNSYNEEKTKFRNSVNVVNHQATIYLENSKRIVNDWTKLVRLNDWTADEIIANLGNLNSDERIMITVLYADELEGIAPSSTDTPGKARSTNSFEDADYSGNYNLAAELKSFRESAKSGDVYITSNFTNVVSGEQCISFVSLVKVNNGDGTHSDAFLMRVEPVSILSENWYFSTSYEEAQICMINSFGEYIYRSSMFKNSNFYEFLISYNDLTYPEAEKIKSSINTSNVVGDIIMKNATGDETIYAYSTKSYNDWVIIGAIKTSDLNYNQVQWELLISPLFTFGAILAINIAYFSSFNRKLKASLKELKKANSAKTQFLSSMSHDIRTPMNAIVGLTEIAEKNIDDKVRVENCLGKISLASNHLLTLINDILDISQVESGKFTLNPTTFSLTDSAQDLVNIIYPQAQAKKLLCCIHLRNITHEYLTADKLRLNQIWLNILSNAVKYTSAGGRIDIYLEEFEVADENDRIGLIFTVKDTGCGMKEEFIQNIFEPFAREKDSRIDKIQGSGLGMAITKQIVDLLGGTIDVQSKEGEGSTFSVKLILDAPENQKIDYKLDRRCILLIGKENALSETEKFINELGGQVLTATNGEQAVKAIEAFRNNVGNVDLIIIDRIMAETTCLDIAGTLKDTFGDKCPVMIISAFDRSDIESKAKALGVSDFINRPIFRTVLVDKLSYWLDHKKENNTDDDDIDCELSGIRLLVAEDNDINWEIISELLEMHGISADRAVNGRDCVNMLGMASEDKYFMILMDIQMPVLNGLEATKEIRQMDNKKKAKIPIIAMTANAFAKDVNDCLDAGMNAHIAKPVNLNLLMAEIKKYMGRK